MTKSRTLILSALATAALTVSAAQAQPAADTRPSPFTYDALGATPSLHLKSLKANAATREVVLRSALEMSAIIHTSNLFHL